MQYISSKLEEEGGSGSDESEEETEEENSGDESPEYRQVRPAAQDYTIRQERRNILEQVPSDDEEVEHPPSVSDLPMSSLRIQENAGTTSDQTGDKAGARADQELPSDGDVQDDAGVSDSEGHEDHVQSKSAVRDLVASTLEKERRRNAKHHSKRGTTKVGRAKGHKGKMNTRVKADSSGVWD